MHVGYYKLSSTRKFYESEQIFYIYNYISDVPYIKDDDIRHKTFEQMNMLLV